jgi:CRISPR/Cas system endoribonuclease Cas6 (RAMP superfamily)
MELYLIKTTVKINSKWNAPLFTGKLVKSFLIDTNPRFKELFRKIRGVEPKLIHITPLYELNGGKVRCLYSSVEFDNNHKVKRLSKVSINGIYNFYIGFADGLSYSYLNFDDVYNTLLNISGTHKFSNYDFAVELVSVNVINVEEIASNVTHNLFKKNIMRVIFSSPTMFRDPFRNHKYKSLVPTPLNVFSTPLYIYLTLTGKLSRKNYFKTLIKIHKLLNETHVIMYKRNYGTSIEIRYVCYDDNKILPAVIGYANYRLNNMVKDEQVSNMERIIYELVRLMTSLGTGTSRASGFGHVHFKV